jgi:hypothetical protein
MILLPIQYLHYDTELVSCSHLDLSMFMSTKISALFLWHFNSPQSNMSKK